MLTWVPPPISDGTLVLAKRNRRPAKPGCEFETDVTAIDAVSVLQRLRITSTVERLADASGHFYEVVAHREQIVRDDRCIVARFRHVDDAHRHVSDLACCWARAYEPPHVGDQGWRGLPCPN